MSSSSISPLRRAWYNWKALRLPWRKRFLVGLDLQGNTFWEFRDIRTDVPGRWRRIVEFPSSVHHADVKVSPMWHQWLRHMREDAPSLEEQRQDVSRRARMKFLAAQADARWAAKPRAMDAPAHPAIESGLQQPESDQAQTPSEAQETSHHAQTLRPEETTRSESQPESSPSYDPWKKAKGPSEDWQPEPWDPNNLKARR